VTSVTSARLCCLSFYIEFCELSLLLSLAILLLLVWDLLRVPFVLSLFPDFIQWRNLVILLDFILVVMKRRWN